MTKTKKHLPLQLLLQSSQACQFLLPTYQKALHKLAASGLLIQKKALNKILQQENPSDLQSFFFTSEVLENFIKKNLTIPPEQELLEEYKGKVKHLIEAFIIFDLQEKQRILSRLDFLDLNALKKLINLYKYAHHKQYQYLQLFIQQNPQEAQKFQSISRNLAK